MQYFQLFPSCVCAWDGVSVAVADSGAIHHLSNGANGLIAMAI